MITSPGPDACRRLGGEIWELKSKEKAEAKR